jgi:hypothetical protein
MQLTISSQNYHYPSFSKEGEHPFFHPRGGMPKKCFAAIWLSVCDKKGGGEKRRRWETLVSHKGNVANACQVDGYYLFLPLF